MKEHATYYQSRTWKPAVPASANLGSLDIRAQRIDPDKQPFATTSSVHLSKSFSVPSSSPPMDNKPWVENSLHLGHDQSTPGGETRPWPASVDEGIGGMFTLLYIKHRSDWDWQQFSLYVLKSLLLSMSNCCIYLQETTFHSDLSSKQRYCSKHRRPPSINYLSS